MILGNPLRAAVALLSLACAACAKGGAATHEPAIAGAPRPGAILEVASGSPVAGPGALASRLARADVVILGERHDNPAHHDAQAEITRRIALLDAPAALVFEMIAPSEEPEMEELRRRGAPGAAFGPLIGWDESGWPDWSYYAPIVDAAPDAPVLGAAVPRDSVREAMRRGAASVFADELGGDPAPLGLNLPLPEGVRAAMAAEQMAAHCDALPAEIAADMVESQRLRDAAFADTVLRGRALGEGPVILIAGAGHARTDRAVPAYLAAAAPHLNVVSVAFVEVGPEGPDGLAHGDDDAPAPFDFLWFTEPFDRGDPCEGFRASRSG